jgi:hypothetical protein
MPSSSELRGAYASYNLFDVREAEDEENAETPDDGAHGETDDGQALPRRTPREEADHWRKHVEQACSIAASGTGTSLAPTDTPLGRMSLPLSREHGQAARLRTSLAVYRMVFGQPRQEDLLRYLVERVPAAEIERIMGEARIELSPNETR